MITTSSPLIRILSIDGLWLEGAAEAQLEHAARLPGMRAAFGMPDLHPGKGAPVGAAFVGQRLYPHLIGADIGCGMSLYRLNVRRKPKPAQWARRLDLEAPLGVDAALHAVGTSADSLTPYLASFGTIGRGNHFFEVGKVVRAESGHPVGLQPGDWVALVHSGSRALGETIARRYADEHRAEGFDPSTPSPAGQAYLDGHDLALRFSRANRAAIAVRAFEQMGVDGDLVLDIVHNYAERVTLDGETAWVQRKGAASTNNGLVLIPGSRGDLSHVFDPAPQPWTASGWSLAHGAGRKWIRSDCRARLAHRYTPEDLRKNPFGGDVVCDDKDLLFEEAPEAYKKIQAVIAALEAHGLGRSIAQVEPVLSYKMRADHHDGCDGHD